MKFVILGSGRGSNAEALLDAWKDGNLGKAQPVAVFSDNKEARILELGDRFGVSSAWLNPGKYKTKLEGEGEIRYIEAIKESGAEIVILAGFMRVIKPAFLEAFAGRIINLHPSLLPSFKGLDGIGQALNYGVKITGCTVHYVTGELDGGPIIDQESVRIEDNDTFDSLARKVHEKEHILLPRVVRNLAEKA